MELPKPPTQLELENKLLSEKIIYLKNALDIFKEFPQYKNTAERLEAAIKLKEASRLISEMMSAMSKRGLSTEKYWAGACDIENFLKTQGVYFRTLE